MESLPEQFEKEKRLNINRMQTNPISRAYYYEMYSAWLENFINTKKPKG